MPGTRLPDVKRLKFVNIEIDNIVIKVGVDDVVDINKIVVANRLVTGAIPVVC